ncbi:hypothetical protein T4C_4183 [Trichinella pseudospiralis]|uniref:Uncharacterized protein n=1 Tax=Trichinella pseudospiralis TaxID=6337 RepID=A0A0V1JQ23_TRIPS|nr:hypothetical protein T4C_4183 [Trichinella pseudospiralis]
MTNNYFDKFTSPDKLTTPTIFQSQRKKIRKGRGDHAITIPLHSATVVGTFEPDVRWRSTVGRERPVAGSHWLCSVSVAGYMSSSKSVGGRNVNSDPAKNSNAISSANTNWLIDCGVIPCIDNCSPFILKHSICLLLHSFDVSKQTPLLAEANADSEDNYDYPEAQADLSVTAGIKIFITCNHCTYENSDMQSLYWHDSHVPENKNAFSHKMAQELV